MYEQTEGRARRAQLYPRRARYRINVTNFVEDDIRCVFKHNTISGLVSYTSRYRTLDEHFCFLPITIIMFSVFCFFPFGRLCIRQHTFAYLSKRTYLKFKSDHQIPIMHGRRLSVTVGKHDRPLRGSIMRRTRTI